VPDFVSATTVKKQKLNLEQTFNAIIAIRIIIVRADAASRGRCRLGGRRVPDFVPVTKVKKKLTYDRLSTLIAILIIILRRPYPMQTYSLYK